MVSGQVWFFLHKAAEFFAPCTRPITASCHDNYFLRIIVSLIIKTFKYSNQEKISIQCFSQFLIIVVYSLYEKNLIWVRPTGHIHLGNYLGALKQWVKLSDTLEKEDEYEQLFCIVDQHALTSSRDAENLASNTLTIAAAYIVCGIDVEKSSVFIQSHVSGHAELAWYLGA